MRKFACMVALLMLMTINNFALSTDYFETNDGIYRLTVPNSYDADVPLPLMIALHSTSSSPHAMAVMTGFDDFAEEHNMIVAYPQADGDIWNEGDPRFGTDRDDVAFINDVVETVRTDYNVDGEQIILSGFGSGGLMAFRVACESPETFDTIAIAGAMLWGYHLNNCPSNSAPVNMIIFRGSEDIVYLEDTYNIRGLFEQMGQPVLGVDETLEHWTRRFNCSLATDQESTNRLYASCDANVRVAYVELTGARQNWLRDRDDWTLNQFGLDVSEMILDFAFDRDFNLDSLVPSDIQARTYSFYVPSTYDESNETPVVFVLHGRFGNGAGTASYIGINELAEEYGFIGIYPDGLDNKRSDVPRDTGWNYLRDVAFFPGVDTHDDTLFLANIVDDLSQDLNIDRNRIYATGLSNGGFMVQRLACDAPDVYAGFASVAGAGFGGMQSVCEGDETVNMLIMHGTHDNNIQWAGNTQTLADGRTFKLTLSIPEIMEYWAGRMMCFGESIRTDIDIPESDDETGLVIFEASECKDNAELILYVIVNGGHNWPGIDGGIPSQVAGLINVDVDATQIIWDFFASHSLGDMDS